MTVAVPVESFGSDLIDLDFIDFIDVFDEGVSIKSVDNLDDSTFLLKDALDAWVMDLKKKYFVANVRL